jgi:hypothetical protein
VVNEDMKIFQKYRSPILLLLLLAVPISGIQAEELPKIEVFPSSRRVIPGSDAQFYAITERLLPSVTTASPTNGFWVFNHTNVLSEITANLLITNAQPKDAGLYRYVAETTSGSVTSNPAALWIEEAPPAPQSYTITFGSRFQLIANHFDYGWQNHLNEFLPFDRYGLDLRGVGGYKIPEGETQVAISILDEFDEVWYPDVWLNPGQGLIIFNNSARGTATITGIPHIPILPIHLSPRPSLLSCQTNTVGTFENIVGTPPKNGAVVYQLKLGRYLYPLVSSNYFIFTYESNAWSPNAPLVPVGEAVWIAQRPGLENPIQSSNGISFSFPTARGQTNFLERSDSLIATNWQAVQTVIGTGGTMDVSTGTNGANSTQAFYRLRTAPDLLLFFQ